MPSAPESRLSPATLRQRWFGSRFPCDQSDQLVDEAIERIKGQATAGAIPGHLVDSADVRSALAHVAEVDRRTFEAGGYFSPEPVEREQSVFYRAIVRICAERSPSFMQGLREVGPTPGMVRRASNLLLRPPRPQGNARLAMASPSLSVESRRTRSRARASRVSSSRTRGSRRTASRSVSSRDGSGGDDPGGEPEPGERPRRRVLGLLTVCALLLCGYAWPSLVLGGDLDMKYESRGADFEYPSMRPFEPAGDEQFPQIKPLWSRARGEALFDDPRQFAADKDEAQSQYYDWWCEVAGHILERSADALDPRYAYLADNLGPLIAEVLSTREMLGFLRALLDGDVRRCQHFTGRLTRHSERSALKRKGDDCFEHFEARRLANGEVRIIMDQRHVSRLAMRSQIGVVRSALRVSRRTGRRRRASRGSSTRVCGSRRITSRSAGGGSPGDDDPGGGDPDPPPLALRGAYDLVAPARGAA